MPVHTWSKLFDLPPFRITLKQTFYEIKIILCINPFQTIQRLSL